MSTKRTRKKKVNAKKTVITLRATDDERELIQSRANKLGHTLSSYVRFVIVNELSRTKSPSQN